MKDYKRVAIVDDFFDIIYGVHVEMDGRGGKHAGQKRTYRAVSPLSPPRPFLMLDSRADTEKPVLSGYSKRRPKFGFKTDDCLMQVKGL